MGEVYLAQHPRLPRQDALKILPTHVSSDQDYRQRFIREADLAAKLWHPNIVRVNDRGESNGQLWIAMDFVDGTDAARLLRDRYPVGMPADEVATIIAAIASALDYAHSHDLLHRDVKPANILLANPGAGERRILLSDFGIARNLGDISGLTATNMTIGTLPYAAPEQLMDEPIDGRADQYALAATAYHLLTGSHLFPESNPAAVIGRHLTTAPPALAATRTELAALDPVLAIALAKAPTGRFARCKDFAGAFAEVTHSGDHAPAWAATMQAPLATKPPQDTTPTGSDTTEKPRRPRRSLVLAAATVIVLTAAGVIGYFMQHRHATPPALPAAVLDGTYRLVYNDTKATLNGAPKPQPSDKTGWWAFRSACASPTRCVATGTKLDDSNHQVALTPAATAVLSFVDGHWQRDPVRYHEDQQQCLGVDQKTVAAGNETQVVAWSLQPLVDGALRGVETVTIVTNECGHAGQAWQFPMAATRTGEVPSGVSVADPAGVTTAPPPITPAPTAGDPVLTGAYRLDWDGPDQTLNGGPTSGLTKETRWWAFRSVCSTATRCVATAATLSDDNQQQPSGRDARVLEFTDGHWQNSPDLGSLKCNTGNDSQIQTDSWSLQPQADGTMRGTETATELTNECGFKGGIYKTPIVLTRIGDVPPNVILADPALF
jgi:serine/threonine-protein kinase